MGSEKKYDVLIIGAGVAGAAAARELSRYELSVGVLEKEADVSFGATKGSHGLVHCGIPAKGAPLRSSGEINGNLAMEGVCRELDVPFLKMGKLLVAFNNDDELEALKNIEKAASDNGVTGMEIITDKGRLQEMEPHLSDRITAALYTPSTAAVDPWALVFGLMENAQANGVDLHVNTQVTGITNTPKEGFVVQTNNGAFKATWIINASGHHGDTVAQMAGDTSFTVKGLRFQRMIMDKHCDGMVRHLVRGLKNGAAAGDFAFPTVDGNIMVGSTVEPMEDLTDSSITREGIYDWVIPQYRTMIPDLAPDTAIKPFAAVIPITGPEFHIQSAPDAPRFLNLMLGVSGFTASVVMAEYLVRDVMAAIGLELNEKSDFNPERKDIPHFHLLSDEKRAELIAGDPRYGRVICRCETVTEGEIVEAIRRGATTRDGVKFRTRAGMGRCQSNFCSHKVLDILWRELGMPMEKITRKGAGSEELARVSGNA